jgi:hypothetical protein
MKLDRFGYSEQSCCDGIDCIVRTYGRNDPKYPLSIVDTNNPIDEGAA